MRAIWVALVAATTIAIDQATKSWAVDVLRANAVERLELLPFLNIVYARNTGVNFGIFASDSEAQQYAFAAFAALVSAALAVWALRASDRLVALGAALLIGGALGNAWDRITEFAVIDFINMDCCGIGNPWAFNVADTAIFLGVALILWATWREEPA